MPERPLLIFPSPTVANRNDLPPARPGFRPPDADAQAARIGPKLQRLQTALEMKRIELQGNALGVLPEQVLVLETIGPVENFLAAVKHIEGLEWLSELEGPDLEPDFGFEGVRGPEQKLSGHLFLVATDQQALSQIYSLFRLWQQDPKVKFERGLNSLKQVFAHLYDIRHWDVSDRIRESGMLEDWSQRVIQGQRMAPFEAELWFRQSRDRRNQSERSIATTIENLGGRIIQSCVIEEIGYHAVLGQIPAERIPQAAEISDFQLLRSEDIMHFQAVGQCTVRNAEDSDESVSDDDEIERPIPIGDPIVALFDGVPLSGHTLLQNRLIIDDPDDFERHYQVDQRRHGTFMSSIICHSDLNDGEAPLSRPVYVRPIMVPRNAFLGDTAERIPENILPVDLIHRCVLRLFENEDENPPVAPTVRIINLSIGDYARPFYRQMSPWARLLDWLSAKYNVLFIISSGNHLNHIELTTLRENFANLTAVDLETAIINAVSADTRNRRILSPAESINGVTVGAIHDDSSPQALPANLVNPLLQANLPATFNAHGPGFRRGIKPDILLPGGRQLFTEKLGNTHTQATLLPVNSYRPPGQRVATPTSTGDVDHNHYTIGTSNAAASASRWGVKLFELLDVLRAELEAEIPSEYEPSLVKALLAHGAEWSDARSRLEQIFDDEGIAQRQLSEYLGRFLGYGASDVARVMACNDQLVTVLGFGALSDGQGHEFRFPLPPSLSATAERRRLTVTLAWISPVAPTRQKYRLARLWFDPRNVLASNRINADYRAVQRGTLQHEVLEGMQVLDFQDGDNILIKINCRADAGKLEAAVRYGLAVTLEVAEGIDIPIYQEIRDRLQVRIPIVR